MQEHYFQRYSWLKLAISVNMIILLKGTLNGKSSISTVIFVNTDCMIKNKESKSL